MRLHSIIQWSNLLVSLQDFSNPGSRSRRDVMFIERAISKRSLLAPAERNGSPTCAPLPETLRSAGARVVLTTGFYKHLAPLEPEHYLIAA